MGLWSACGSHPFLGFTKENKQNSKQTTEWHGNCCCLINFFKIFFFFVFVLLVRQYVYVYESPLSFGGRLLLQQYYNKGETPWKHQNWRKMGLKQTKKKN